jgi:hypothetical protein
MDPPRRKPLPVANSLSDGSPQPVHDERRASFPTFEPDRDISLVSSEVQTRRSLTSIEGSVQESTDATYEPPTTELPALHETLWKTGYTQNIPWPAVGSLLLALSSTVASAIILIISNGDTVSNWRIDPSVLLAILSATSTACLSFSLARGVNVW